MKEFVKYAITNLFIDAYYKESFRATQKDVCVTIWIVTNLFIDHLCISSFSRQLDIQPVIVATQLQEGSSTEGANVKCITSFSLSIIDRLINIMKLSLLPPLLIITRSQSHNTFISKISPTKYYYCNVCVEQISPILQSTNTIHIPKVRNDIYKLISLLSNPTNTSKYSKLEFTSISSFPCSCPLYPDFFFI